MRSPAPGLITIRSTVGGELEAFRASSRVKMYSAAVLIPILAASSFTDLRSRTIPDCVSLGGALVLVLVSLVSSGPVAALTAVWGALVASVVPLSLHLRRPEALGGGDVKLSAAIGAGLGPIGIAAVAIGALLALLVASLKLPFQGRSAIRKGIPFAPYLAAGALATLCVV